VVLDGASKLYDPDNQDSV